MSFALLWILANATGWTCAIFFASTTRFSMLGNAVAGGCVAAFQWLLLQRHLRSGVGWIAAGIAGWFVGLHLGMPLGFGVPEPYWTGIAGGAATGFLQWIVLAGQVRRPGFWIIVSIISSLAAWTLGRWAGVATYDATHHRSVAYLTGAFAGGIVSGVLTAPALPFLLRPPER